MKELLQACCSLELGQRCAPVTSGHLKAAAQREQTDVNKNKRLGPISSAADPLDTAIIAGGLHYLQRESQRQMNKDIIALAHLADKNVRIFDGSLPQ